MRPPPSRHPADLVPELYRRFADDWIARREWQSETPMEAPWLESFVAGLPPQPRVLDLGCGSGRPLAEWLIEQGAVVTGVDVSGPLIATCRQRWPDHRWIETDMRGLDLDETFDGVLAWHSAFHLPAADQLSLFAVHARHCRAGGSLMFTSGSAEGVSIGDWNGEPLHHDSLSPEAYERALDAAGFDLTRRVVGDRACGDASVWLARRR